jgi:histidinol-phosphate aminotransferase
VKALAPEFRAYTWAPPSDEVARVAGIDASEVIRFDQNTPPLPARTTRPGTIAGALARINNYPAGGYRTLRRAIADYAGVEPENVVLGAGADDLILLVARAYAGPGDTIAIPQRPTYPLYRIAAQLAGAHVTDCYVPDAALTFFCRPNNPTGALEPLPDVRPLVVDEAYYEYCGDTAAGGDAIVLRTFSKLFGLAGARIGYALAPRDVADELNARQAPAPVSSLAAELAIAALASNPDPRPEIEERERLASAFRALGLAPLPSATNFLYVPVDDGLALGDAVVPMDDALARAAVDLGGRPHAELNLQLDPGMAAHMLMSLAQAARAAIHVEATGRDPHHTAEAAFKAVGRALRIAVHTESDGLPSTKGVL